MRSDRIPILPFLFLFIAAVAAVCCCGCEKRSGSSAATASGDQATAPAPLPANTVDVLFVYGSEKQDWIDAVTPAFNDAKHALPDGNIVHISTKPMGSGESMDDILSGRVQADVWSPASGLFVTLANAQSQTHGGPLVRQTQNLVLSPMVFVMWQERYDAFLPHYHEVTFQTVAAAMNEPGGWTTIANKPA